MNIQEALNAALEYENKVYDVYNDNADKLDSAVAKKIFAVMAKEEADHVKYLKAKIKEWKQYGKAKIDKVETAVPDAGTLKKKLKELKQNAAAEDLNSEIEIFKKALALEKQTSKFYKNLVSNLSSEDKAFFERFINIEEGHERIIQAEIDCAQKSGFWFDFMEFDLEEA